MYGFEEYYAEHAQTLAEDAPAIEEILPKEVPPGVDVYEVAPQTSIIDARGFYNIVAIQNYLVQHVVRGVPMPALFSGETNKVASNPRFHAEK